MNPQRQFLEALVAAGDLTGENLAFKGHALAERPSPVDDDGHSFVVPMPTHAGEPIETVPPFDPNDPAWRQYDAEGRGPRTPFGCFRVKAVDEFIDDLVDRATGPVVHDWLKHDAKVFFVLNEWGDTNTRTNNVQEDVALDDLQRRCIDFSIDKAFWYGSGTPCFVQDAHGRLRPLPCSMAFVEEDLAPQDLLARVEDSLAARKAAARIRGG